MLIFGRRARTYGEKEYINLIKCVLDGKGQVAHPPIDTNTSRRNNRQPNK